ncbi:unnamed protein product [Arabis nemorensis]|uniref:RRM domain-containing protein n=1 Tax=Arabis nemorensis TaxID=586526 RepID=A0A565CIG2_9BRAS|nr:unnamed protein product [Arabis nemorensis]
MRNRGTATVTKHFSSCGEIVAVLVAESDGFCLVSIRGDRATEKAVELNGCKCDVVGGCKIVVDGVLPEHDRTNMEPNDMICGGYDLPDWLFPPKPKMSEGDSDGFSSEGEEETFAGGAKDKTE